MVEMVYVWLILPKMGEAMFGQEYLKNIEYLCPEEALFARAKYWQHFFIYIQYLIFFLYRLALFLSRYKEYLFIFSNLKPTLEIKWCVNGKGGIRFDAREGDV